MNIYLLNMVIFQFAKQPEGTTFIASRVAPLVLLDWLGLSIQKHERNRVQAE